MDIYKIIFRSSFPKHNIDKFFWNVLFLIFNFYIWNEILNFFLDFYIWNTIIFFEFFFRTHYYQFWIFIFGINFENILGERSNCLIIKKNRNCINRQSPNQERPKNTKKTPKLITVNSLKHFLHDYLFCVEKNGITGIVWRVTPCIYTKTY